MSADQTRRARLRLIGALALLALAGVGIAAVSSGAREPRLVTIITGARGGVYSLAGGKICALVNAGRWRHGLRCIVERSGGSIENLRALRRGRADFAIVQSDWQAHALRGTGVFEGQGRDTRLRAVLSLYPEPFTVLARAGSGIARFSDLKGKRVSVGPTSSGSRATMEAVMHRLGWTAADFAHLADLGTAGLRQALCRGDIDAAVLVIAHPNLSVEEILGACDTFLAEIDGDIVQALSTVQADYFPAVIPAGTYGEQAASVEVFALAATLVTSSRVPPSVVREVAAAVLSALPEFRAAHPAFSEFAEREMLAAGLTAPLHEGARQYYIETQLIGETAGPRP